MHSFMKHRTQLFHGCHEPLLEESLGHDNKPAVTKWFVTTK